MLNIQITGDSMSVSRASIRHVIILMVKKIDWSSIFMLKKWNCGIQIEAWMTITFS